MEKIRIVKVPKVFDVINCTQDIIEKYIKQFVYNDINGAKLGGHYRTPPTPKKIVIDINEDDNFKLYTLIKTLYFYSSPLCSHADSSLEFIYAPNFDIVSDAYLVQCIITSAELTDEGLVISIDGNMYTSRAIIARAKDIFKQKDSIPDTTPDGSISAKKVEVMWKDGSIEVLFIKTMEATDTVCILSLYNNNTMLIPYANIKYVKEI